MVGRTIMEKIEASVFYVLYPTLFFAFHVLRMYGSIYQLFHKKKRSHKPDESKKYYGGIDFDCLKTNAHGFLTKTPWNQNSLGGCLRKDRKLNLNFSNWLVLRLFEIIFSHLNLIK